MKKNYKIKFGFFVFVFFAIANLSGQQSYTFTNCNATGTVGPTQTQINTAYFSTNLNGQVTATTNGIQTWTVPYTGNFRIEARGAQGGASAVSGGLGATMIGDVALVGGEVLQILVGQMGDNGGTGPGGGGGGSFVVRTPYNTTVSVLMAAGGGSGDGTYSFQAGQITTAGGMGGVAGGTNGNGGGGGTRGAGGGGFLTDGAPCSANSAYASPGQAYINGGEGGPQTNHSCGFTASGGFGGGSSHGGNCINNGGAGGGFSGGGGSSNTNSGGGGSYNSGSNQNNTSGNNSGHGRVVITELCNVKILSSASGTTNPATLCSGNSLTLTTDAVSNYSWSTGQTTSSIVVAPNTNTVYSVSGTSSLNCTAIGVMSITVSSGLPVLSISNPSNNICLGKAVSLTASGALSYTWSNPGVVNGQTFTPSATTAYTVTGQNGCGTTVGTTTITVAPLAVSASASPTLVCQGYTSTLTANAAVNGFTWSPSNAQSGVAVVSPNANTIYTVTASDGTCSGTATVLVNTKTTPTITTVASTTNICEGGQVTITANGASTYTWNPGNLSGTTITVSPATSTLYAVDGTNNVGCTASAQQIVLVNAAPPLTAGASKTLACVGGSVVLNAGGALSYSWTNGPQANTYTVFPTGPTVYTVTGIGSNGCPKVRTVTVNIVVPNVTVPATIGICEGSAGTITASGANTYSWNGFNLGTPSYIISSATNTFVLLSANTLSLAVNCVTHHTINVIVNSNPTVSVVATKTTVCRNQPTTLTASGATNYDWGTLGTTASVVVSPSVQTNYQVIGTNASGCESIFNFIVRVVSCNSIDEKEIGALLTVYPNPNNGYFIISSEQTLSGQIYNNLGQLVQTFDLDGSSNFEVKINDLANGVYYIVAEKDGRSINEKVVISK